MLAAILNSANLNLTFLDSAILIFPLKLTHTCQDWFPPFAQKNFTHSFWLNFKMAAILNSAMLNSDTVILDSDTLLSSLTFIQTHSHFTLTLTQTHYLSLNLMKAAILNSAMLDSTILHKKLHLFILTQLDNGSHLQFGHLGFSHISFSSQTHSHLPRLVPTISKKKTSLTLPSSPFAQNTSLIQSD